MSIINNRARAKKQKYEQERLFSPESARTQCQSLTGVALDGSRGLSSRLRCFQGDALWTASLCSLFFSYPYILIIEMVVLYCGCCLVIFSFLLFLTLSSFFSWGSVRNLSSLLTFRKSYRSDFVTLFLGCLQFCRQLLFKGLVALKLCLGLITSHCYFSDV